MVEITVSVYDYVGVYVANGNRPTKFCDVFMVFPVLIGCLKSYDLGNLSFGTVATRPEYDKINYAVKIALFPRRRLTNMLFHLNR